MTVSLRARIILILLPLLVLLLLVGGVAMALLHRLGGRADLILRENYESVIAMQRLNEALERIDSSFQFALASQEDKAREQYNGNWKPYFDALTLEEHNITLPGEEDLVHELARLTRTYHDRGDSFYAQPTAGERRRQMYFGQGGLLDQFKALKDVSGKILRINQENMKQASKDAQDTASESLWWLGLGLAAAVAIAGVLAWHTSRGILRPIANMIHSAKAIGAGNLDQVVPVLSGDELGQLAEAFNGMARQLRQYRQTDYARLLRAQRNSQATIDAFPDPVVVLDEQGRVEMANPAAGRVLGVPRSRSDTPALPWQPPDGLREPLTDALQRQTPYLPQGFDRLVPLAVDGQQHSFLPRILPIRDPYGNTLGAALLLQDVTRYRLLDEVKSDLVATVSHELKTPLTSIRLALHLVLEEATGPLLPKQTELLLDARDNAERLLARINSLLDLAQLEQKRTRIDLRPESPGVVLEAAADAIRPRAQDKEVTVTVEAPPDLPPVVVDPTRLGHALGNLLDNALTYTERGGHITLKAEAAADQVILSVTDTGAGIAAEHLPHVFEKFFRVPGQSRGQGTGLGLAIVRQTVQAHGGTITCDSRPGEGTTFRVTLPAWKEGRDGREDAVASPAGTAGPTG